MSDINKIKEKFIESCILHSKYINEEKINTANKYARECYILLEEIKRYDDRNIIFDELLNHEEDSVKLWCVSGCIDCNYRTKKSIEILTKLAYSDDFNIRIDSRMTLRVKCNIDI